MGSKRELLATIEQQKEQIGRYETKLKDVVRAYKGLLKEKEALSASLCALGATQISKEEEILAQTSVQKHVSNENKKEATANHESLPRIRGNFSEDEDNLKGVKENNCKDEDLLHKINTLTAAVNTLSTEKNRIELSFQNDKKRLLTEKEKLEVSLLEATKARKSYEATSEGRIQELKSRIIVAQHERDSDTQNAAVMLRELESKLAKERLARERVESSLEHLQKVPLAKTQTASHPPHEQYEKKITDLQNELKQVRSRLQRAEQLLEAPPMLKKLEEQMDEMKMQHLALLEQERSRAASVENTARELARSHEERVALLEENLAELSVTVASYDRTRQSDLKAIQTLKEKLAELSQENQTLSSSWGIRDRVTGDQRNVEEIQTISRRMSKLRDQLIVANSTTKNPVDIHSLLCGNENIHLRCQEEYDTLKVEFENYKSISKQNLGNCNHDASGCQGKCQLEVEELNRKVQNLQLALHKEEESHAALLGKLSQELNFSKKEAEASARRAEADGRASLAILEQQLSAQSAQMSAQIQRSLTTLQERDLEIQRLNEQIHHLENKPQQPVGMVEATAALLSQVSAGCDGPLLHHLEEIARRDQELASLRKQNRELDTTMREVQLAALQRQQAQMDTIEELQEQVQRLLRNTSREGENLEYLKNVVLRYMTSSDAISRTLMLKAIAAILKFTDLEVDEVKKYNALWWWQPAPKTCLKPQY